MRWFREDDQAALEDLWRVYEPRYDTVTVEMAAAMDGTPLAAFFRSLPEGELAVRRGETREAWRQGVASGDWSAWHDYLRRVAVRYTRDGLSFTEWSFVARVLGDRLSRMMIEAYLTEPRRLAGVLDVLHRFLDHVVTTFAVEFLANKERESLAASTALQTSETRLRALAARLTDLLEEERRRIAREIHDELGQTLTALKLDIAWLAGRLDSGSEEHLGHLGAMSELVDKTIRSVRRLATELRPGVLDDLGVVEAIAWHAREFEARTGIRVDLATPVVRFDPDRVLDTVLFRSFQELLTNVARHSGAKRVVARLEVLRAEGVVQLEVADDGRGIRPEEAAGAGSLGLLGLRERAALVGGTFAIARAPTGGTVATVRLPARIE